MRHMTPVRVAHAICEVPTVGEELESESFSLLWHEHAHGKVCGRQTGNCSATVSI